MDPVAKPGNGEPYEADRWFKSNQDHGGHMAKGKKLVEWVAEQTATQLKPKRPQFKSSHRTFKRKKKKCSSS